MRSFDQKPPALHLLVLLLQTLREHPEPRCAWGQQGWCGFRHCNRSLHVPGASPRVFHTDDTRHHLRGSDCPIVLAR